jgi:photosystem II stability/assembly factor-like uncharacterized protein
MAALYAAMRGALVVVRGVEAGSGSDAVDRRLADHDLECVAVHPDAPDVVLVGTFDGGLYRSDDGGEAFVRVGEGVFDSGHVTSLAVNPHDPGEWWAGTEPSAVYRSTDAGRTWARRPGLTDLPSSSGWSFPPRPETHHVRWIEVDPADPARLYVGIEAGALVRTDDRGATWTDRVPTSRRDNHSLATHPDAPGRAWSAAGDGYAETDDGGETWEYPQAGLDHRYCWSVAVDPGDPGTVLVSAASGAYRAHRANSAESYVYRKRADPNPNGTGGGGTGPAAGRWERLDDRGLPTGEGVTRAVIAAGLAAGEFYAATNEGLYRTRDAGDAWTRLDVPWDELASSTARGLAVVP